MQDEAREGRDSAPGIVVLGAAARDIVSDDPRGWRLGGGVSYSALTTALLGVPTGALVGVDELAAALVHLGPSPRPVTVLVAGEKAPRRVRGDSSFHLVERGYGRFARGVRLTSPCDGARATAVLSGGELRISIPKVVERRGRSIRIAVTGA